MPLINDVTPQIWAAAIGILVVAVFLGLWQWFDRRSRDPHTSSEDLDFFRRQDRRRYGGVAVMVAVALLFIVGSSRTLDRVFGPKLLGVWVVVCVLIVVLLALALVDALATQKYARRQLKSLAQERTKLMLEAIVGRTGQSDSGRRKPDQKSGATEL
jgi:undecaprenyl pyrophosphate phosphatase UppP